MNGSRKNPATTRERILAALKQPPAGGDYVWDGRDEDDRPLTEGQLRAGIEAARRGRGRPVGSGIKEVTTLRIDRDVLSAFRASGEGWQTRINALLREALEQGRITTPAGTRLPTRRRAR